MRKRKIKNNKIINILLNQNGMALLTTLIFVFILVTFAVALLTMTSNDTKLSALQRDSTKAFYIAEAGIERTLYNLKKDYENSKNWDTNFDEGTLYDGIDFGDGKYTVYLSNLSSNTVTIKSKGVVYDKSTRYVQIDATIGSLSIWDNAIFAGSGQIGKVISGNVDIRGSVHILGTEGSIAVEALDITGTAGVGNNYIGMNSNLRSRIINPPTTVFNGETVETLNAKLRVKRGKVNISGNAKVGNPNVSGNVYKETLDGVYIGDGTDSFGGNQGESNVYSDNGTKQPYDFGEGAFSFPTLDDDYIKPETGSTVINGATGLPYSYKGYYDNFGLKITDISSITSTTNNFNYSDGKGNSINWNKATGILNISGIIVIDENFSIGNKNYLIQYEGVGTIVSKGDISIYGDLLAKNMFPTSDALGLIAYNNLNLATDSQLKMMGAFYAQNRITSAKQNEVAGTFVSNYFDMGGQVPSIYQVPDLINNMPPGMLGAKITYSIHISNWHEVHE